MFPWRWPEYISDEESNKVNNEISILKNWNRRRLWLLMFDRIVLCTEVKSCMIWLLIVSVCNVLNICSH